MYKLTKWIDSLKLKGSANSVLRALASYANNQGFAFPSVATIAEKAGVDRSTVFRVLTKLEKMGLIVRRQQVKKNGSLRSNLYNFNADCVKEFADQLAKTKANNAGNGSRKLRLVEVESCDEGSRTIRQNNPIKESYIIINYTEIVTAYAKARQEAKSEEELRLIAEEEELTMLTFGAEVRYLSSMAPLFPDEVEVAHKLNVIPYLTPYTKGKRHAPPVH